MEDKLDDEDAYLPSLEEIEDKCRVIRSTWSESKKRSRSVIQETDLVVQEISIKDIFLE